MSVEELMAYCREHWPCIRELLLNRRVSTTEHVGAGHRWVVDVDLESFFDRVNHDVLMARVARRIKDKRVLRLIRRYLQAGMCDGGVVGARSEGPPQGGPLSPLLSNILLDEWDKEPKRRGHVLPAMRMIVISTCVQRWQENE